jgi:hypothetical protein
VRFGGGEDFQHKHGISESSAALIGLLKQLMIFGTRALIGGPIARADPGYQEHSEAAVVESRQPRPAAACYGPVSRPGSPLHSGALVLACPISADPREEAPLVGD